MTRGGIRENSGRRKMDATLKKRSVPVALRPDTIARLDRAAAEAQVSRSAIVERLVQEHLEKDSP
jgi:hypothetical protein